jgi:choline kinase
VIGMVLAAGAGSRLGTETESLPKTLLPVDWERTILDIALSNMASVGLEEVVVVTGFAAERIDERVPELERQHGVRVTTLYNPKALVWNNAYSLWCAREYFSRGVLMANGDTVHPVSVEERLLESRGADLLIAVDDAHPLGAEEMKVHVDADGHLERINKALDPAGSHGEYIGVTLIEPAAAEPLADALEAVWRRDTTLYYEDGFQEYADRGGRVGIAPIGTVDWVEVDDHADLARAREVACRC